jgi:hypothetical protein
MAGGGTGGNSMPHSQQSRDKPGFVGGKNR